MQSQKTGSKTTEGCERACTAFARLLIIILVKIGKNRRRAVQNTARPRQHMPSFSISNSHAGTTRTSPPSPTTTTVSWSCTKLLRCPTLTTAQPISRSACMTTRSPSLSSPAVPSSTTTTAASRTTARAAASRCISPAESARSHAESSPSAACSSPSPTRVSAASSARGDAPAAPRPGYHSCSRSDPAGEYACCGRNIIRARAGRTIVPVPCDHRPARHRSRLVLPLPLRPTISTRSPPRISTDRSWISRRVPHGVYTDRLRTEIPLVVASSIVWIRPDHAPAPAPLLATPFPFPRVDALAPSLSTSLAPFISPALSLALALALSLSFSHSLKSCDELSRFPSSLIINPERRSIDAPSHEYLYMSPTTTIR
ncbi:unnamed protein product [Chondrus crispus]|uniref:Uncharacterized protein n=1 Tax=Chondrus crispus TaxID=2769 RepID=R7QMU6_CHOCR|nr:unnamed protein product [Chondrus crispus]CDF39414.1 unnamed protein product [Chondrus crispus]|eukprot:XP_005719325.1 unnamed protein product [Chondrus crispus]